MGPSYLKQIKCDETMVNWISAFKDCHKIDIQGFARVAGDREVCIPANWVDKFLQNSVQSYNNVCCCTSHYFIDFNSADDGYTHLKKASSIMFKRIFQFHSLYHLNCVRVTGRFFFFYYKWVLTSTSKWENLYAFLFQLHLENAVQVLFHNAFIRCSIQEPAPILPTKWQDQ